MTRFVQKQNRIRVSIFTLNKKDQKKAKKPLKPRASILKLDGFRPQFITDPNFKRLPSA